MNPIPTIRFISLKFFIKNASNTHYSIHFTHVFHQKCIQYPLLGFLLRTILLGVDAKKTLHQTFNSENKKSGSLSDCLISFGY